MNELDTILKHCKNELILDYIRSTGPGGQNVNKVATAAHLRFDVRASHSLPVEVKARLIQLAGKRITNDGVLLIEARRHRTQDQNREEAIARFSELLIKAFKKPKQRWKTKPSAASKEKRLLSKKKRSDIKRKRRIKSFD